MPLVILQYLYSLQIKGDSNKKKCLLALFTVVYEIVNPTVIIREREVH
jgi:hypothetical protein